MRPSRAQFRETETVFQLFNSSHFVYPIFFEKAQKCRTKARHFYCASFLSTHFGPSGETRTPGILLPKQARYQLRYTRLWNCFICGLSCGLGRFLTTGFAKLVPTSGSVPAGCEVGSFPSWMGGICSQITRAANYATFGHRYFSRPGAFFPTYVRQYTLRSAALALWHHLLLDRGQHDGFILYLSILPVSPPKSSLFASGRYVGKAVRRLWGLRTA